MSTVLAAVDDSAAARPVLEAALALAPVLGAGVEAVHVADAPGRTALAAAEALSIPLRTVPGDPLRRVLELVAAPEVVAVVVGARDGPAASGRAGHLAVALAGGTPKPVLVVPPQVRPAARLRRVLIAMEGTRASARRLQQTVELGAGAELELLVVHVHDVDSIPSFGDQVQYEVAAYADEFLARFCPGAPSARVLVRVGVPADEILAAARQAAPDLLAIGWPQTDDPARGQVAREILRRSEVPVLVVALAAPPGT